MVEEGIMGIMCCATISAYTSAAAGLLMGCSLIAALGLVSSVGVVVSLALAYRMTWSHDLPHP
jgi:hypothetical protein